MLKYQRNSKRGDRSKHFVSTSGNRFNKNPLRDYLMLSWSANNFRLIFSMENLTRTNRRAFACDTPHRISWGWVKRFFAEKVLCFNRLRIHRLGEFYNWCSFKSRRLSQLEDFFSFIFRGKEIFRNISKPNGHSAIIWFKSC